MATIQERRTAEGQIHYRALVRVKGCPVRTATFERKTETRRWATQLEGAFLEGRRFPTREIKKRTFAELIDRYGAEVLRGNKGEEKFSAMLAWWCDEISFPPLPDSIASRLAAWHTEPLHGTMRRKTKQSRSTVNRYAAPARYGNRRQRGIKFGASRNLR